MDRKTLAIVVLTVTAMLLAGVVAQGLRDTPAYGQAGRGGGPGISYRYSDYVMAPMKISENADILCLTDTVTQRMLFFKYDGSKELKVYGKGVELAKDFAR